MQYYYCSLRFLSHWPCGIHVLYACINLDCASNYLCFDLEMSLRLKTLTYFGNQVGTQNPDVLYLDDFYA